MPKEDDSFRQRYLAEHPDHYRRVDRWLMLASHTDDANRISYAYEDWLKTRRTTPAPDLVEWFSWYGYVDSALQTWRLPIKLTDAEMEQWRQAGYLVDMDGFQDALGGVAGGIAEIAGKDPQLTAQIMQRQLDEKLAELNRLADLSLDEHYTPRWQEWQVREMLTKNHPTLKGEEFEEAVMDEMAESTHDFQEVPRFEAPFHLRQQLESLEWGMENLRLVVMGEVNPEIGLPNKDLFMALMQIDLNGLIAQLSGIDEKLKRIWKHLAEYKCYCLNAEHEPEKFWWRHYKARPTKKKG